MNILPKDIENMIREYATTEYEPFSIRFLPHGRQITEHLKYVFESQIESKYIIVRKFLMEGGTQTDEYGSQKILRENFRKTMEYIIEDNMDGHDIEMKSGLFYKLVFIESEYQEEQQKEALEWACKYFEVAIKNNE